MTKQDFIEAGWALQFLNKKAPTGYRPKDIYLAWEAAA